MSRYTCTPVCNCAHPLIDHCDDGAEGYCIHESCDCDGYEALS